MILCRFFDTWLFKMLKLPLFSEIAVFETRTWDFKTYERLWDFTFMASLNREFGSESPNFLDVPSNLPFSTKPLTDFWKTKTQQTNSSLEITVIPTVVLQRLRKFEWRQQRVARMRIFDALRDSASKVDWIVFSQKVLGFREERKARSFLELIFENIQSSWPLLDPFTKIFFTLQLVAAFYLFS